MRALGIRLALLLALAAGALGAQSAVVKKNVNLRSGPSSASDLLRTLTPGDELALIEPDTVDNYLAVRTASGMEGWVYAPRVRVMPDGPSIAPGPPEVYRACGLEGNAVAQRRRELNRLKNRVVAPAAAELNPAVTLAAMLSPGDDAQRWSTGAGATITGFVLDVKPGGQETVNCGEKEEPYRDTHIEVVLQQGITAKAQRVIVEITPRWREFMKTRGEDWSTATLRARLLNRTVRFTGWLFFDDEHDDEAENTRPGRADNWRATAWELHPVTRIEVVP